MAMIKFDNVEKYYGKFHALKNINLEFEKGEVVVVIGPSGSGKSTMLRCINGLETISSGRLLINDIDLQDKKTKLTEVRKNIWRTTTACGNCQRFGDESGNAVI